MLKNHKRYMFQIESARVKIKQFASESKLQTQLFIMSYQRIFLYKTTVQTIAVPYYDTWLCWKFLLTVIFDRCIPFYLYIKYSLV